jgi:hypothetical protein
MTQTEQEIEKLKTLNDNYTELVDIFDHLVPREYVVLTLSAPSDVDWTMYSVVVINNDKGTSDTYAIPSNGVVEFEVKYDTTYTIKLPILGDFIAPKDLTFTAGMKMREVGYSYRIAGVFGIDANGKYYSIAQIEALEDKSIIKYGGYTDGYLEDIQKLDGTYGCGVIWKIDEFAVTNYSWAGLNIAFDTNLLPFVTTQQALDRDFCDGEGYTDLIISDGKRLSTTTQAASFCRSKSIDLKDGKIRKGFLPSSGQFRPFQLNETLIESLYSILGVTIVDIYNNQFWMSHQTTETAAMCAYKSTFHESAFEKNINRYGGRDICTPIFYPL